MKVLMVAEHFGFGPVGSLMSCREQLAPLGFSFRFVGPALAWDIIDEAAFERCTFFEGDSLPIDEDLAWCDLVWSATEPRSVREAAKAGKRVVFYDPLFWFWPVVPPVYVPGMLYLCQNFPGVMERVRALPPHVGANVRVVAPPSLVCPSPRAAGAGPRLMINLCGFRNPIRHLDGYTEIVMERLQDGLVGARRWERVTVVGSRAEISRIELRDERIVCRSLPHREMLRCISTSDLVITSPGLNSAMEAMSLGVPVAFLPPQNATQARQLCHFAEHGVAPASLGWDSLAGECMRWHELDEVGAIEELSRMMAICASSEARLRALAAALSETLSLDAPALTTLAARQADFFASLSRGGHGSLVEVLAAEGIG